MKKQLIAVLAEMHCQTYILKSRRMKKQYIAWLLTWELSSMIIAHHKADPFFSIYLVSVLVLMTCQVDFGC